MYQVHQSEYLERFRKEHPESSLSDKEVLEHYYLTAKHFTLGLSPAGMDRDGALLFRVRTPIDFRGMQRDGGLEDSAYDAEIEGTVRVLGENVEIDPVFRLHGRESSWTLDETWGTQTNVEASLAYGHLSVSENDIFLDALMKVYVEKNGSLMRSVAQDLAKNTSVQWTAKMRAAQNEDLDDLPSPSSILEALHQHFLRLPEKELSAASKLLAEIDEGWARNQGSSLILACKIHNALTEDSSSVAQGVRKALDDHKPKFLHYQVRVDEMLGEGRYESLPMVRGWTAIYDEHGVPCTVLPFAAKPDLHGVPIIECDWANRKFQLPNERGDFSSEQLKEENAEGLYTLSPAGYRKAVDDFLKKRRPEIESSIERETLRVVNSEYFFGKLWNHPDEYGRLRHFLCSTGLEYSKKRSPEWAGIFLETLGESVNQALRKGMDAEELADKITSRFGRQPWNPSRNPQELFR